MYARPGTSAAAVSSALPTGPDAGQANSDHRERQAADFVATHAYDQAIRIYDQLAVERPQNPAFREAARILRQKLDAGTPCSGPKEGERWHGRHWERSIRLLAASLAVVTSAGQVEADEPRDATFSFTWTAPDVPDRGRAGIARAPRSDTLR